MTDDCDQKPKFYGQEVRDQHALAIGRIAMAWNELHEVLAEIFGYLFNENDYGLALTAWHSLASDAAQREMLRAVAAVRLKDDRRAAMKSIGL